MTKKKEVSYSAGALAQLVGVSTDSLRYYEAKGVIKRPPRQANGYRLYPPETLARVQLVRRALALDFTLDELAEILRVRDGGGAPCRQVRKIAAAKLESIEERLRELVALRDELRATLKDWDARLAKRPARQRSRLLETPNSPRASRPLSRPQFKTTAAMPNKRKNE